MSKRELCAGGCGRTVGTGCGCCSDDFPEQYGYCGDCFKKSDIYADKMQVFNAILDRADLPTVTLLREFLENYDADFERDCIDLCLNRLKGSS